MLKKDVLLIARDEISSFATENSPCNFSMRSSLSDLTFNSFDPPDYNSGYAYFSKFSYEMYKEYSYQYLVNVRISVVGIKCFKDMHLQI